ncbi:MAG: phycobilisome rod-core linker polypeptide, partial [Cyanobacteria bacterium P01_D01_bin.36]
MFCRPVYAGQEISNEESRFNNDEINVREFVKAVAKSESFRKT